MKLRNNLKDRVNKVVCDKAIALRCDECEYTTSRDDYLKRHHKGVHEKNKDKRCNECDFASVQASNLKIHSGKKNA